MTEFPVLTLWFFAYIGVLVWSTSKRSRLVGGGLALILLSLGPTIYGRWTTPSDWHDHALMVFYYLPTILAACLALIIVLVGLVMKIRQALLTRGGA